MSYFSVTSFLSLNVVHAVCKDIFFASSIEGPNHTIIQVVPSMNSSLHVRCKERQQIQATLMMNAICLFSESVIWLHALDNIPRSSRNRLLTVL